MQLANSYLNSLRQKDEIHIEMVCHGNICRSPLAAAVAAARAELMAKPKIVVTSSGTSAYHQGEGAHPLSVKAWQEAGYSYSHTSKPFLRSSFETLDLILVADLTNRAQILAAAPPTAREKVMMLRGFDPALSDIDPVSRDGEKLQIPDPWGGEFIEFVEVREMIEVAVDGLFNYFSRV